MSPTGKNYRSVLDVNGQYNNSQLIHDWNKTSDRLKSLTSVLCELVDIRDGYKECDGLTCKNNNAFILDLCINDFFCVVISLLLALFSIHLPF